MRKIYRFQIILGLFYSFVAAANPIGPLNKTDLQKWVKDHSAFDKAPLIFTIAPMRNDMAADLVDELRFFRLEDMDRANLKQAQLDFAPWSGSYWPMYAGSIANRYADPNYHPADDSRKNFSYLMNHLGKGNGDAFSAAEKYDLLVGDSNFSLSKAVIQGASIYADRSGNVPSWFGICHGWAPASFMMPRPQRAVSARAPDGREVVFTPTDLKALASLLWANGNFSARFISSRCEKDGDGWSDKKHEPDTDCFDTNPATWHMAVVNQIGVSKRSFVMDASTWNEVWNQPILGYKYGYINPATGEAVNALAQAKVKLSDWPADPYKKFRARNAVYVVQIVMDLQYVLESTPTNALEDSESRDNRSTSSYSYDLELNGNGDIVGGEWWGGSHPDFLWVPKKGISAVSRGDTWLGSQGAVEPWNKGSSMPQNWRAAAKIGADANQPLAYIVNRLFEWSNE